MRRYVIERDMPGAGDLTHEQLRDISRTSNAAIESLGSGIQWEQSYVTADRVYCVYRAENEDLVREHARRGGFPASRVSGVANVFDALTAEERTA